MRQRLCESSTLYSELPPFELGAPGKSSVRPSAEEVWCSLETQEPPFPPMHLPPKVVARFLEAQLHLGQVTLQEVEPLMPHLAHAAGGPGGRPSTQLAHLLILFLGRGGHAFPWLWRRAVAGAFLEADARTKLDDSAGIKRLMPSSALTPLADCFAQHLELLRPLALASASGSMLLSGHLRVLSGGLARLWALLGRRSGTLPDSELQEVACAVPRLFEAQDFLEDSGPLSRSALQCARALSGELQRRDMSLSAELRQLLTGNGVQPAQLLEDVKALSIDSIVTH
ncbi:unnamed protein product [Effrenium voratum]|nr:unnamed protein product [Effrenium voratum]